MQVTQEMYVRVEERNDYSVETGEYKTRLEFSAVVADMSEYGWIMLPEKQYFTFEVPDALSIRELKAKALKKEMDKVRADFQAKITELQSQYNNCLAIEA